MNKIFFMVLFLFVIQIEVKSQVGVKVDLPLTDLHINGSIQIVKDLKVGGSDKVLGDSGNKGQFLKSNGDGENPEWVNINIPIVPPGSFSLVNSFVFIDKIGGSLDKEAKKRQYLENELLTDIPKGDPNAQWIPLKELSNIIEINEFQNKINFTIQTMAHLSSKIKNGSTEIPAFTYAIGVFIGGKLKAVKPFKISGLNNTFTVVTLITTIENIEKGKHQIDVAIIPRKKGLDYEGELAIGRPNKDSDNISSFMSNTSMKVDIFEVLN